VKICTISYHSCPFSLLGGDANGGMSVYLKELSASLACIPEVNIDIFTRIQTPVVKGIKNISSQVRVIHLKGGPEYPVDKRRVYDFLPEFSENFEDYILRKKERYDLIFTHYWLSGLVGERIKFKYGLPLIHVYHTLAFFKKRALRNGEHISRMRAEQHLAWVSDAIVSSSFEEKKNLIGEYGISPSKAKVIYPGVNPRLFFPIWNKEVYQETGWRESHRILLYVGRIDPVKGLMTIVETFELLKKRNRRLYDQLKLLVIGGGRKNIDLPKNDEFVLIKDVIRKNKLGDKIVFLGSRRQSQLKSYYSAADALVVPSLYESFGLVVIEALACGTPVLVSRIGEMHTLVKEGKNGFSFRSNDPPSLAYCLENFFCHKERLWGSQMMRQDIINKFSWEKTAEQTYRIFTDIKRRGTNTTTIFQPDESLQPI